MPSFKKACEAVQEHITVRLNLMLPYLKQYLALGAGHQSIANLLAKEGIYNPVTGKPYSHKAIGNYIKRAKTLGLL